jgi:hypothetical protein
MKSHNLVKIRPKARLQDRHNHLLSKQEMIVVLGSSTTLNKNSSGGAASAANLADEISLMRKIKAHLANCQCCKDALNSDSEDEDNIGAGIQPAPSSTATTNPTAQVENAIT